MDLSNFKLPKFKKAPKKEEKKRLVSLLSKILDRNPRGVYFITIGNGWTEEMLSDAIRFCESYSNVAMRNKMFNQYKEKTII